MRTVALSVAISISKSLDLSFVEQIIFPIVLKSINDPSFEVRLILIKNITKVTCQ